MLEFKKQGNSDRYSVVHPNSMVLGELIMLEDGFFAFWPKLNSGAWPQHMLLTIGNKLAELNAAWEEKVAGIV